MPLLRKSGLLAAIVAVIMLASQVPVTALSKEPNQGRNFFSTQAISPINVKQILVRPKPGISPDALKPLHQKVEGTPASSINKLGVVRVNLKEGSNLDEVLALYRASGLVDYAEPNYTRRAAAFYPNDPLYSGQWGLSKIGMESAWEKVGIGSVNLSKLSPIKVAVLDTGVDLNHEDLQGIFAMDPNDPTRVLGKHFYTDALGRQRTDDNIGDGGGHGTHLIGIIGAVINNNLGIAGIAPAVKIMPVKVLNDSGAGEDADIARGIIWAADNGARIINLSLAGPEQSNTLADAVKYAIGKGVIVVAAAGNNGDSIPSYPAANDGVIGIGAADSRDVWMHKSNFGSYIDLVAPGSAIISTVPPSVSGKSYGTYSGTSMAAGFVSGLAALILSINPNLSRERVEAILYASADDLGASGWDKYYGYGRINASRAVDFVSDNTPPYVTIVSPANGAKIYGTSLTAVAAVSDPESGIAFVDFYLNGERIASVNSAPYQVDIDASRLAGKNVIKAVAYNRNGNFSSAQVTCYRQTFTDVEPSFWAFEAIEDMAKRNIVSGFGDGSFRPNEPVKRAQFVKMIMEAKNLPRKPFYVGYFRDVDINYWAWSYVEGAFEYKIVGGYLDSYGELVFRPENAIKRAEMATILFNAGAFDIDYSGSPFKDVTISYWAYVYIMSARNAGIINGYTGNYFIPERAMTRAEAVTVIKRAFFDK